MSRVQIKVVLAALLLNCSNTALAAYPELAAAIRAGDLAQVEQQLAAGVSAKLADADAPAPLLIAASRGKHAIARLLLSKGADPDPRYPAYYNATALMLAVDKHDHEMVSLLLDAGAKVDLVDINGDPALNWAAYYGDRESAELLLQKGANAQLVGHGNALEVAMRRGHQALVSRLTEYMKLQRQMSPAELILLKAVAKGDGPASGIALRLGASPNTLDQSDRPLLAWAAREGSVDVMQTLLDAGATVDAEDRIGFTALHEAAREGQLEAVKLLLARKANPQRPAKPNGLAMSPLHLAASAGRLEVIRELVQHGASLDSRDREQATPLHWAINESPAAAQLLAELGANPDLANSEGVTARQLAERNKLDGLLSLFNRLLKK